MPTGGIYQPCCRSGDSLHSTNSDQQFRSENHVLLTLKTHENVLYSIRMSRACRQPVRSQFRMPSDCLGHAGSQYAASGSQHHCKAAFTFGTRLPPAKNAQTHLPLHEPHLQTEASATVRYDDYCPLTADYCPQIADSCSLTVDSCPLAVSVCPLMADSCVILTADSSGYSFVSAVTTLSYQRLPQETDASLLLAQHKARCPGLKPTNNKSVADSRV